MLKQQMPFNACAIDMPEVSEAGGRALLSYFYTHDLGKAVENSGVATELFEVTHAYNIPALKKQLMSLFNIKDITWFRNDAMLKVFRYLCGIECCTDLMAKVVQMLDL